MTLVSLFLEMFKTLGPLAVAYLTQMCLWPFPEVSCDIWRVTEPLGKKRGTVVLQLWAEYLQWTGGCLHGGGGWSLRGGVLVRGGWLQREEEVGLRSWCPAQWPLWGLSLSALLLLTAIAPLRV
jgi:hypothetical protein